MDRSSVVLQRFIVLELLGTFAYNEGMFQRVKHQIGDFLPALRSPNYRLYFIGQGISLVGTWMAAIAEQWLIYPVLTNNRSLLGIASAVNLLPTVALVLFSGVVADRINRRNALLITQVLFMVIAFMLGVLVFTGAIRVWHVFLATFIAGIVFAFDMPIRQSFMVTLVEKKDLASALSLNSGIFNAARAFGPAIAGFLIVAIGIASTYLVNGASFLAVILAILLMKLPTHVKSEHPGFKESFKEGFRYVATHKIIAVLLVLIGVLTFTTWPAATLLPVFAHDIFNKGEAGFGMLQSALGLGAVVGSFGLSKVYLLIKNKYNLLISLLLLIVISVFLFGMAPTFSLAILFQVISGWSIATFISTIGTLIMTDVPDHLRGRIMSFYSFMLIGGMPLGGLVASLGVATIGARATVSVMSIVLVMTSFFLIAATKGKFKEKLQVISYGNT